MEKTKPKSRGVTPRTDPAFLVAGRYGTDDMIRIWGAEKTYEFSLKTQSESVQLLSDLYPDIVPAKHAKELISKANLEHIDSTRIREIEENVKHDVIAINTAWEECVEPEAAIHINKAKASADTTETAKALQIKESIIVIINSLENLRDIVLEKSMNFSNINIDVTHLYDALPTITGRPFSFYAEMLQSGMDLMAYFYTNSIIGKWGDATGNHHSATTLGIDGMELQENYCDKLGIKCMTAAAQIPGREFITDFVYAFARVAEIMGNLANYVRWGRSDDVSIFKVLRGGKGSSSMPHKDVKGGNPIIEEQTKSFTNFMRGTLSTSLSSCEFDYARDLTGSASDRILLESMFKFGDHVIRRFAGLMYDLDVIEDRCIERVERTFGTVTSEQVMTYLTDPRKTKNPMSRKDAHELMGELATKAYKEKIRFIDILLDCGDVTDRLSDHILREITDPMTYVGQSKEIIQRVFQDYHGIKTLGIY